MRKGYILTILVVSLGLGAGMVSHYHAQEQRAVAAAAAKRLALAQRKAAWQRMEQAIRREAEQFPGKVGVIVEDLSTGWRVAIDEDEPMPAASMIKVPIMSACFKAEAQDRLSMDETIVLKAADRATGSGVMKAAVVGTTYAFPQLIELMITRSDNTASNLIIRRLGFDALNESFADDGLSQTTIVRRMMDFSQRKRGVDNFTSAADIAASLRAYYRGQVVNSRVSKQGLELLKRQALRDRIPAHLPAEVVVAHKTGLERHVVHDAGIIFTTQGDILVAVLTKTSAASKTGSRPAKAVIARIARHAYDYLMQSD